MSHELHYTSAPRGLKPGSRGFCTVACTAGLPAPLADRLESLSGYRQVFPPNDPSAGRNPVAWSHLRLSVGGKSLSILSRVGFAGLDYTDRTNKYAHHVAISSDERPAGGPAWLLSQPGFMDSSWTGEPRILPSGRRPPSGDSPAAPCHAWASTTGDAGWAGVVAASLDADPDRPIYLIFEPGMDLLPLVAEALSLLPPARRWDVTFSTYFTGLPSGVACTLRCVLSGSREAAEARRFPNALVLDLTAPLGSTPEGDFIRRARSGQALSLQTISLDDSSPEGFAVESTPDPLVGPPPLMSDGRRDNPLDDLSPVCNLPDPSPRRKHKQHGSRQESRRPRKLSLVVVGVFSLLVAAGVLLVFTTPGRWGRGLDRHRVQEGEPATTVTSNNGSAGRPDEKRSDEDGSDFDPLPKINATAVSPLGDSNPGKEKLSKPDKSRNQDSMNPDKIDVLLDGSSVVADLGVVMGCILREVSTRTASKGSSPVVKASEEKIDSNHLRADVPPQSSSVVGPLEGHQHGVSLPQIQPIHRAVRIPAPGNFGGKRELELDMDMPMGSEVGALKLFGLNDEFKRTARIEACQMEGRLLVVQKGEGLNSGKAVDIAEFRTENGKLRFMWIKDNPEPLVVDVLRSCLLSREDGSEFIALRGPVFESRPPITFAARNNLIDDRDKNSQSMKIKIKGLKEGLFDFEKYRISRLYVEMPGPISSSTGERELERSCHGEEAAIGLGQGFKLSVEVDDSKEGFLLKMNFSAAKLERERDGLIASMAKLTQHGLQPNQTVSQQAAIALGVEPGSSIASLQNSKNNIDKLFSDTKTINGSKISVVVVTEVAGRTIEVARIGKYAEPKP